MQVRVLGLLPESTFFKDCLTDNWLRVLQLPLTSCSL